MKNSLKSKIKKGIYWSFIGQLAIKSFTFCSSIIIARMLHPSDFGLIGLLSIFIAISTVFIEGGFGKALVQKNKCDDIDFSTVLIFNFILSIFCYTIIFSSAPLIAKFFNDDRLILISRIVSLKIIFSSLSIIQLVKLKIDLNFKKITQINVLTSVLVSVITIFCAFNGLGYWSLVIQIVSESVIKTILYWSLNKIKIKLIFSYDSLLELFAFGSKLMLARLYANVFNNTYNVIIGKYYSVINLGLYTRANRLSELTEGTISIILNNISFPVLSSLKNDYSKLLFFARSMVQTSAFVTFPALTILSILSEPLILLLLGSKWISVIPILQIIVFARITRPLSAINLNLLNAIGRSDLFLKIDILKLPIVIITLYFTLPFGIEAMIKGQIINNVLFFLMDAYFPGKLLKYGPIQQIYDIKYDILSTIFMAISLNYFLNYINSHYLKIFSGIFLGTCIYLLSSYILGSKGLSLIKKELVKN